MYVWICVYWWTVVCFLLGNSPASEFYMPTFRDTLSVPSSQAGRCTYTYLPMKMEQTECSKMSAYKIQMPGNYPEENIQHTEYGKSLISRMANSCRLHIKKPHDLVIKGHDWQWIRYLYVQTKINTNTSFMHLVVCLMTCPKPLPKQALHIVWSRASSFKWEYPLLSLRSSNRFVRLLPCLPVTSIPPFIFPSTTRCRRQVLCNMWPIQFAYKH